MYHNFDRYKLVHLSLVCVYHVIKDGGEIPSFLEVQNFTESPEGEK